MKRELLEIENFLTIKQAKIEVRPITVLIGENSTGKSIISKLLYLFRESLLWDSLIKTYLETFPKIREGNIDIDQFIKTWKINIFSDFKNTFPSKYLPTNFRITYIVGDKLIAELSKKSNENIKILLGDHLLTEISTKIRKFLNLLRNNPNKENFIEFFIKTFEFTEFLESINKTLFKRKKILKNIFIPHARLMYFYLKYLDIEKRTKLFDYPMRSFISFLEMAEVFLEKNTEKNSIYIFSKEANYRNFKFFEKKVINGELIFKDGEVKIKFNNKEYDLFHISSGQQELIPLILILRYILYNSSNTFRVLVEEPETHLFPKTQRDLVNLFGFMYNINTEFFITTHSPYILTSFNTLLLARSLYEETKNEAIKEKYQHIWIDPKDFIAYQVKDGTVQSIMDHNNLIKAEIIDEVSESIAEEIDNLLDIAYEE